jgi:predicted nucleic acid-binding protein
VAQGTLAAAVITLDTSAIFALLNRHDSVHRAAVNALEANRGPFLVPAATLGEVGFLVEERLGDEVLDLFLEDLESGAYTLDCGEGDISRVRTLVRRYADLSLGVVDAAVIACAERSGGRVMTFDLRDFGVVAAEGTSTIVPEVPDSP